MTVLYTKSLRELEATFIKRATDPDGWLEVDTSVDADGVFFLCPVCFHRNNGPIGTHSMLCWFVGRVPSDLAPGPGRWVPNANPTIDNLTFIGPSSKSIACGAHWHGFIRDGQVDVDMEGPVTAAKKLRP